MIRSKKTSKSEDDHPSKVARPGKYRRKEPPSPHVADYIRNTSGIVRQPTAVKRSEHVLTGPGSNKSLRSLSVPSLHATAAEKVRYSPPSSPPKPRSRSVRHATKKATSFKRNIKKWFGSHLELDENGIGYDEQRVVGTYRPLTYSRPRSIGGSSDCSNSSTYTTEFSRTNSLRDSSRSRISHGNDSVFQGGRQPSCDSTDNYPMHMPSGSTDSSLRQHQSMHLPYRSVNIGDNMQRSSSSTSLKNFGIQTKIGMTDPRYHSVATEAPFFEEHGIGGRRLHRHMIGGRVGTSFEDTESLWEDSKSFTFMNKSVHPSDPEYRQVAEELMSASPTHKTTSEVQLILDPRRMSDAGSIDPRRGSLDSGVDILPTVKRNQSLPSTPITKTFATAHTPNGEVLSTRERSATPIGYLSQESGQALPPGWEIAYTEQGLRYYLDHNSQATHWDVPQDHEDTIGLPSGWEAVKSGQYGTYYVNHNNRTAIYQHPYHARPPPPYQRVEEEDPKLSKAERRAPARSHSHRSQSHRVLDPHSSLLRRSKSVRDQEIQKKEGGEDVSHERQLSVVTFVPPSPYQSKEIPLWLKKYVDTPFGSELDLEMQAEWRSRKHSYDDLNGWDTMIKRLLKKGSEKIVKGYEYYRVAIQQELEDRLRERRQFAYLQRQQQQQQQQQLLSSVESLSLRSSSHYPHPHHHSPYYQQQQQRYALSASPSPSPSTSSSSLVPAYTHSLHSDPQHPSNAVPPSHHLFSPTASTSPLPISSSPHSAHRHHSPQAPPTTQHTPTSLRPRGSSNSSVHQLSTEEHRDDNIPKYDTMIEKRNHTGQEVGVASEYLRDNQNSTTVVVPTSNGLRPALVQSKGFLIHPVSSADHVAALPRQGSTNFSDLFETAQNVQETFV